MNTIPITGKTDWQKLGVTLQLPAESLPPPPPPLPKSKEGSEEGISNGTEKETNSGAESDEKGLLIPKKEEEVTEPISNKTQTHSRSENSE